MTDSVPPRRRSTAPFWIVIVVLFLALGFSLFLNVGLGTALLAGGGLGEPAYDYAVDEFPEFEEEWSFGDGDIKAVRLELNGIITREAEVGLLGSEIDMVSMLERAIRAAAADDAVGAIVLEVNSPGGGITESDELYQALQSFRASREDRRVVVWMKNLAASGGYYVAMAGDWLIAEPTTIVGSIGVIMQTVNWKSLSERIGISDVTIKSGKNKDLLNPFRETEPAELALLQDIIDEMHTRFRGIVADGRGLTDGAVAELADGRIFTSGKALELGLIDEIGYWEEVAGKTRELLGTGEVRFIRYYQPGSFWDLLAGIRIPSFRPFSHTPALQYLWNP